MRNLLVMGLISVVLGTSGCGVKPDDVEPPPSAHESKFPHTYPDPSTDPAP